MFRSILVALFIVPGLIFAQDETIAAPADDAALAEVPTEVDTLSEATTTIDYLEETSSLGGATGFVFPIGFYISGDFGAFWRLGGYGDNGALGCIRCKPVSFSSTQPWIGFNIGYDLNSTWGFELSLSNGFVGDAAPVGYDAAVQKEPSTDICRDAQDCLVPEHYSMTMLTLGVAGTWYFLDRLAFRAELSAGGAYMTPDPNPTRLNAFETSGCGGSWGDPDPSYASLENIDSPADRCGGSTNGDLGIAFGLGLGLRYATLATNLVVGLDVNLLGVYNPNVQTGHLFGSKLGSPLPIVPGIALSPVIKYVI